MKKISLFLLAFLLTPLTTHAFKIDEPFQKTVNIFLDDFMEDYYKTKNDTDKYEMIKRPINYTQFNTWWESNKTHHKPYYNPDKSVFDLYKKKQIGYEEGHVKVLGCKKESFYQNCYNKITNALALAISVGRPGLVKEMLAVVPDINDSVWDIKIDDHTRTLAHLAVNAEYPRAFVSMSDRLAIIDMLAQKGLDFNRHAAGTHHPLFVKISNGWWYAEEYGHDHLYYEIDQICARAMIYGATPLQPFTNISQAQFEHASNQKDLKIFRTAFDMYTDLQREGATHLRLDDATKHIFGLIKDQKIQQLQGLEF